MLPDWLIDWSSWVFVAFLNILKKHDRITGSQIRRKFCMQKLNHLDFVLYASAVNEDAEYCLSLLKRIPSSTRSWSLRRSQTTHVQSDCESSTGSSSSAAAHPSPAIPPPAAATASASEQQWWRFQLHHGSKRSKGCQPHGRQHCELHIEQRVRAGAI